MPADCPLLRGLPVLLVLPLSLLAVAHAFGQLPPPPNRVCSLLHGVLLQYAADAAPAAAAAAAGLHPFYDDRVNDLCDFKIYLDISGEACCCPPGRLHSATVCGLWHGRTALVIVCSERRRRCLPIR